MSALNLSERVERWAQAEVAEGRALSVAQARAAHDAKAAAFQAKLPLSEAQADAGLVIDNDVVFARLDALYPDE